MTEIFLFALSFLDVNRKESAFFSKQTNNKRTNYERIF